MKYPYIPIEPIINELQAQLKQFTKEGKLDTSDCYQYAVQCLRLLGCHEFDINESLIKIANHRGPMGKDFYLFEEVRYCTQAESSRDCVNFDDVYYTLGHHLRPIDVLTQSYCYYTYYDHCSKFYGTFSFKIPPGIIATDVRDCLLYVKWYGLKKDNDGNHLMQDEENGVQAVKSYIKLQVLEEAYLLQQVPRYIYQDIKAEFNQYFSDAQNALVALGTNEVESLVDVQRRRLNRFNLK